MKTHDSPVSPDRICSAVQRGPTQKATPVPLPAHLSARRPVSRDTFSRRLTTLRSDLPQCLFFPRPTSAQNALLLLDLVAAGAKSFSFAAAAIEKRSKKRRSPKASPTGFAGPDVRGLRPLVSLPIV